MKMLRKTIVAVAAIVFLRILIWILDRLSPSSAVFHRQFLFSLQLVVTAWFVVSLILIAFRAGKSWVARFLPILIVMVVLAIDILFSFWMEKPARIPGFLKNEFKSYYSSFERNIIDFEPCSVYDSAYSHKFIPGLAFTFGNIEYKNNYRVNSESLRDKEDAMSGPQIICLGNSYTLGIGAEAQATFPNLIASKTGKTVLNTGNSSYGTVRELKRLVNADTSFLQYVVIQYSKYDVYENAAFVNNKQFLRIASDSAYKKSVKQYKWRKEYFPGKYAVTIGYDYLKGVARKMKKKKYFLSGDTDSSATYFLKVIDRYNLGTNFKILVTEINDYNDMDSGFLPAVDSLLQGQEFAHLKGTVKTVNVADLLTPDDYYVIDSHLRPSGYEKVADRISYVIRRDSVAILQYPTKITE
jgi:hypothetical protein